MKTDDWEICHKVGLNLQNFRRLKHWTQEELAFEADLHRTYISGIESGKRNPTIVIIAKLAKTLGVEEAAFFAKPKPMKAEKKRMK